ncbi:MAG: GCN5-related N-acetyltransferase [Phycisphaerales bacterium]|nr:GCN5-related N-acetyltransferase [Phycisphaerales bacterium]
MHIRTIKTGDGPLLKELTLRSVAEAPYAFGGLDTLAEEQERPDQHWDGFAAECAGDVEEWRDRCVGYVAFDGEVACAKAIGFLSAKDPTLAQMSGVWIDPRFRRQGLGRRLVGETCEWAVSKGANRLLLWVDDANPDAARFYEALGFKATGKTRPVGEGSPLLESAYKRPLSAG